MQQRNLPEGKILVTGANGRLGRALTAALRAQYGRDRVISADLVPDNKTGSKGPFRNLNVLDKTALLALISEERIQAIYHLAGMLPAFCEQYRDRAWETNIGGLVRVLDAAKIHQIPVCWASSIAVFGEHAPKFNCPQHGITQPRTVYGMTKLAGEHWCHYYHQTFGVDVRALRFPGIYSPGAAPRGGMMDLLHHVSPKNNGFTSYLHPDTLVNALHIRDAVQAAISLMTAPAEKISIRTAYNLDGFSFSARQLAHALEAKSPGFRLQYRIDERQAIAEHWPHSLDDRAARHDWSFKPAYDLSAVVAEQLSPVTTPAGT